MLTAQEKLKAKRGFIRGLPDTVISRTLGVPHVAVFKFRHQLGITKDQIWNNRYDTWKRLVETGKDLPWLADRYEVKEISIRKALWRNRGFSFVEAKRKLRDAQDAQALANGNDGWTW